MKKRIAFVAVTVSLFFFSALSYAGDKTVRVKTKQNYIRESERFYSKVKATVAYDEVLSVIEEKNEWLHVRYKDVDGWIHSTAVSEKKAMKLRPVMLGAEIDPESGGENHEIALAGKGFTPEVEKKLAENDPGLNYALVDEITGRTASPEKINTFIKEGGLKYPK